MDWLVNPIADFMVWTFGLLECLQNTPNWIFIIVGFLGMFYWLYLQRKFNRQADADPNQLK